MFPAEEGIMVYYMVFIHQEMPVSNGAPQKALYMCKTQYLWYQFFCDF